MSGYSKLSTPQKTEIENLANKNVKDNFSYATATDVDAAINAGAAEGATDAEKNAANIALVEKEARETTVKNNILNGLNSGDPDKIAAAIQTLENARGTDINDETYTAIMAKVEKMPQYLNYMYIQGKISDSDYVKKMSATGKNTSGTVTSGWNVSNLNNGKGDRIAVAIGSNYRSETKDSWAWVTTSEEEITNENTVKELNELATGDGSTPPNRKGGNQVNGGETPGKLVMLQGDLYIYTKNGWRKLVNKKGGDDLNKIKAMWYSAQNYSDATFEEANSEEAK